MTAARYRKETDGISPLFEMKPLRTKRLTRAKGDPPAFRWARYRPKVALPCDVCKAKQVDGTRPKAALAAAHCRTAADGTKLYLCYEHSNEQRRVDGLATYRKP